jgi:hypothetical protein
MHEPFADLIRGMFSRNAFIPRCMTRMVLEAIGQTAVCVANIAPPDRRIEWQELANKLEAFYLFSHVDTALDLASDALPQAILKALDRDSYQSVWAMEGLGHYFADRALQQRTPLRELLQNDHLPDMSLVPLHTGMALLLAEFLLSRSPDCQEAIDSFLTTCFANSRTGYARAACEALGLVMRNLYPHLIESAHSYLLHYGKELISYFWHGIGRAIYFSPSNFLPARSAP